MLDRKPSDQPSGLRRALRGLRSPLAMVISVAVIAVGLTVLPSTAAQAAVVEWGTASGTAPNYQATVNGDYLLIGNGVLACTGATVLTANQATAGSCDELHAATGTSTGNANDNFRMLNSNTVAGFTTNSSSATVTIPAGATVAKAFLNWSANTGTFLSGTTTTTSCVNAANRNPSAATLPAGSATGYQTQPVQLKVGAGAVTSVPVGRVLEDPTTQTSSRNYSAGADVTSVFASATTGSAITVSAGSIWAPQGAGCYAGWSLTVVYDYGTFVVGQPASIPHRIIYYEGHVREASTDAPLTVNFSGFAAITTGTRMGMSLFEGDRIVVGDTAAYSRQGSATFTEIPNSAGATGNVGIGRANGSIRYTGAGTTTFTNVSVDAFSQPLPNVVTGDTSVALRIGTTGDSYLLRNAVLSVPVAAIQIDKTFSGSVDSQSRVATENATFTITVTNTGAGDLQNITIADDQTNCARTLTGIVLAPLASTTFTCVANGPSSATYTTTATATGFTVNGNFAASDSDTSTVLLSAIALTKTSALAAGATGRAGDIVNYSFVVTNSGSAPLTGVTISDPLVGLSPLTYTWPGAAGTLTAGQSATASATYTLTQADVDAGSVANTATTVGADNDGGPQPTASASRTTPIVSAGALAVTKSGAYASGTTGRVGEVINYAFTIKNTGNVTLTNTTLTDPLPGLSPPVITWPTATAGRLAPGQTATATATYTITQANVDAGVVNNTATSTAKPPTGPDVSASSPQSTVPTIASAPSITTTKSGVTAGTRAVGDVITYSFSAKNTGNVTLTGVAISDPLVGLSTITYGTWPSGTTGTLSPGQTVTATATYTITQADVDAGSVRNTATTTGKPPTGANVTGASPQSTVPTAAAAPSVALTKTGSLAAGAAAGSIVTYAFSLKNTGNVTLTAVTITDPLVGLSALSYTWPGMVGTLSPGQTVTATATYTLKQSDVDAGSVANTATGSGTPPTGANVTQTRSATVPITQSSTLEVTKSGVVSTGAGGAGDTITYSFSVRNSGNVSVTQVAITDPLPGISALTYSWPGAAGTLTPGQTATATATYVIKQSDVDAGSVKNTATGTAKPPTGANVTASSPQVIVLTAAAAPSIATTKSASRAGAGAVGDVITYTFTSKNTGNVTLTGVAISDPLAGLSAVNYGVWPSGTTGTLTPGQTITATATYAITQADVDAGSVTNTATSTGKPPTGANVTAASPQVTTGTAASLPSIALTKSGVLAPGSTGIAGDTVSYAFSLKNTGNVTLTAVTITDPLVGLSAVSYTWPGAVGTLSPGQTVTATASYVLKQSDVDAGSVANTATGSGKPPTGANATQTRSATVPVTSSPALLVTKAGTINPPGSGSVGDVITYSISARNTGNVTLTAVAISDTLSGLSALTYTWPGPSGTLTPGQTVTATATYTIVQADVDAGSVKNIATATGKPPTGANATASSPQSTTATVVPAPAILTAKSSSRAGTGAVGDVITYSFSSKNTGNVTLTGVTIADPLPGLSALSYTWPGASGSLSPGQTVTATATYTITQADVDTGSVKNTATGSGNPPTGAPVSSLSPQVTTATAASAPATVLTKSGSLAGSPVAGSTVTYAFTLRNSGNVTLTAVAISDPLPGLSALTYTWPATVGRLLPGQTVTASASYTVSQADVDAGSIANTATSTAKPPTGANVGSSAPATVPLSSAASLAVTKSGAVTAPGTGLAGDTISYSFTISNTGNVTLSGVTITDSKAGVTIPVVSWPGSVGTLAPGQTAAATATYQITQADVDAGSVRNTATTSGRPPTGANVQATSTESVVATASAAPSITTTKSGAVAVSEAGDAGDSVLYSFRSTNSGNVTLTGVTISDPKPGLSTIVYGTWPSGTVGTLAPGQSITASATYRLTQADVDGGSVSNTASSIGNPPNGAPVADDSPTTVVPTAASAPSTTFSKSGALAPGSTGSAGDTVNYTFSLRNSGNVTLTAVAISDPLPGLSALSYFWPGTAGTLAPGQTVTATASYQLRQADVDAGAVSNTAVSTATPPTGAAVTGTASATVPVTAGAAIVVTKAGVVENPGTGVAGNSIAYSFEIRNAGNVTLTGITLTDSKPGVSTPVVSWPGTPGQLSAGQIATATATYTVTQADVDAGSVSNTASAAGNPPTGAPVEDSSEPSVVALAAPTPGLAVTKAGTVRTPGTGVAGDTIDYAFEISNTGNVTLTLVDLIDSLGGVSAPVISWPGTPGTLAPGQTAPATATYTITQSDVDAGSIVNIATVTGKPPTGANVTASSPPSTVAAATPASLIATAKSAVVSGSGAVGDTITYTLTAQNTGNVTLSGVVITDLLPGLSPIRYGPWPSGTVGELAPGQTVTATSTYVITQADVDRGSVVNTAASSGTSPQGLTVTDDSPPVTTPTAAAAPALTATKTAALAAGSTGIAGNVIEFVIGARNAGNVTLTGVTLTDALPGISTFAYTWPGTPGTLSPGQSVTATASYVVTQADVDTGSVANTVTAIGTSPSGLELSSTAPATVPIAPFATLDIIGTGVLESGGIGRVGDIILFSGYITYAGNVTLTSVLPSASLGGLFDLSLVWPGTPGKLLPGQDLPGSGRYAITQADVDRGYVESLTGVSGRTPAGLLVSAAPDLVRVNTVSAVPAISTSKSGIAGGARGVGDTVTYTIVTTNTGNVTLTGVTVADSKPGLSAISVGGWPTATAGTLAPGDSVTSTATYVLTQADVDAGSTTNTASSSGTAPSGSSVSRSSEPAEVDTAPSDPRVTVTDSGVRAGGATAAAGDTVTFTYTLANTGNVTLSGVEFTDTLAGIGAPSYSWPGTPGILAPGESVTATATYPLTQADVDRGSVRSDVRGVGTPPSGADVAQSATSTVTYTATPAIEITQTAVLAGGGNVGDTITFSFDIVNTGNQTLTAVDITKSNESIPDATISWQGTVGSLAPGQSATATAVYTITQADVDAGVVRNIATTTGRSPSGDLVTSTSTEAVIPLAASAPSLTTTKTGTLAVGDTGAVGDIISYGFTIANTGNVTLTEVTFADPLPGLSAPSISWPSEPGTLAPGTEATATANYTITQADVDRGSVRNTATSRGTPPTGAAIDAPSGESVVATETSAPRISVTNSGALAAGATGIAGDTVTFSYSVTNTGNVSLTAVSLADTLPGVSAPSYVWTGTPGTLAPNETATATATYVLTQADVDAGSVTSIVTGTGSSPAGVEVSASAPATVPITSRPGLAVTQNASIETPGIGEVGDIVFITVVVTNTGNVTLTNGRLVAPLPGLFDIVINWPNPAERGTLLAGQSMTGSARYVIRQVDVDAGFITNVVDLAANIPSGGTITAVSNSITIPTVRSTPRLTTTKTGAFAAQGRVGDTITYTITALNSGNVTLSDVEITDPLAGLSAIDYGPWPSPTSGTLMPGQSVTGTATYIITQNDVDNGAVVNTATSAGTAPDGTSTSDPSEPVSTATVTPTAPELSVTNSSALAPGSAGVAGDTVLLTYTLRNSGDVTLFESTLVDPAAAIGPITYTWPGDVGTIAPGQSVTATATYLLTQADVDAGAYVNVIDGSGTPRVGAPASDSAASTVTLSASPNLSMTKSGTLAVAGDAGLGDIVDYSFSATNEGNVTLSSVSITDPLPGVSALAYSWPTTPGVLAPGETVTATATYALRQIDLDRGRVDNTASVSGTTPGGQNVLASSTLVSVATEAAAPSILTTKSGVVSSGSGNAGSTVTYTFTVINAGNVTLRLVSITDPLPGVSRPIVTFPTTSGILAPGETAVGTARYTLRQSDVDSGSVINTATGRGTAPDGRVVSDASDPSTVSTAPAAPTVTTTQTAALAAGDTGVVGDTVEYAFAVANTGNVTLSGITLANTVPGLGAVTYTWPGAPGTLAPGQSVTATATRLVTQADVDAGVVRNVTTGSGTAPSGAVVSDASDETSVTLVAAAPALTVTKSGVASGVAAAGDTITWTLAAENSGDVTLTGVALRDSLAGISALSYGSWPSGTAGTLAPGQTVSATATSTITQADVDAGSVRNTATADALAPNGSAVSASSTEAIVATVAADPSITISKQQAFGPGATGRAGDTVVYSYQVVNSGNQTLNDVAVDDAQAGIGAVTYTWPGAVGTLRPGETVTATATYVLTQADVDAGSIASLATTTGSTPAAVVVSAATSASLIIEAVPALAFTKTGSFETLAQQGGRILYAFQIINTGNVTMTGAAIADAMTGLSAITYTWPGAVGDLLPGEIVSATATYTISQADVDAGTVVNTATVSGFGPDGATASATDGDTQIVPSRADIRLTVGLKLRAGQRGFPGDVVEYTYTVVNTGTTTLTGVQVIDPRTGLSPLSYGAWPGTPGVLLPGQSVVASAFYVITQADAGTRLTTNARVTSTNAPDGTGVLDEFAVAIQLPAMPIIVVPPSLAFTGNDPAAALAAAATLLLSGLVLTLLGGTRRRKETAR